MLRPVFVSMRGQNFLKCRIVSGAPRDAGNTRSPTARGRLFSTSHTACDTRFGGLPGDATPHVLRHSFASLAADLGYSEPTIAALVGHKGRSITSRYVHSADAVLLAAADAVANRTVKLIGEHKTEDAVVPLRVAR
jgi:integrase